MEVKIGGIVGGFMGAIGTALAAKLLGGKKPPKPPRVPKTTPPKVRPRKPRIKGKFGVLAGIGGLLAGGMTTGTCCTRYSIRRRSTRRNFRSTLK